MGHSYLRALSVSACALLAAGAAAASAGGGGAAFPARQSFCFPRAYGPKNNPICLAWQRVGADFVFEIQCTPDSFPEFSIGWCAVGFSTATPPGAPVPALGNWTMFPSDIIHLQVVQAAAAAALPASASAVAGGSGGGGGGGALSVVVTDRVAVGARLPACAAAQPTRLLNASIDAVSGMLTAFFARPAELPRAALAQGLTSLNRTLPIVAAISNNDGAASTSAGCAAVFECHDNEWRNETIDCAHAKGG